MMFSGLEWYESLSEPKDDRASAWRTFKGSEAETHASLLIAGLAFAEDHALVDTFRRQFSGIAPQQLLYERARAQGRRVSFPIWEIANELVVARYLERVLGWGFQTYEPRGWRNRLGDWQFGTEAGDQVFVEVKSLQEPMEPDGEEIYGGRRSDYRPQLRQALRRAYRQLPDDGRATLVVLVGTDSLSWPAQNIFAGDLFETLFGKIQVSFAVMPFREESMRMGPSLRDMFVHHKKNSRLGCVAGLRVGGSSPHFYSIVNPFAQPAFQLAEDALRRCDRFILSSDEGDCFLPGLDPSEVSALMSA